MDLRFGGAGAGQQEQQDASSGPQDSASQGPTEEDDPGPSTGFTGKATRPQALSRAGDYRSYGPELDVFLPTFADPSLAGGSRLIYREDPAAIDARMPLAVHTDMYPDVELDRLGIVDVEGAP